MQTLCTDILTYTDTLFSTPKKDKRGRKGNNTDSLVYTCSSKQKAEKRDHIRERWLKCTRLRPGGSRKGKCTQSYPASREVVSTNICDQETATASVLPFIKQNRVGFGWKFFLL